MTTAVRALLRPLYFRYVVVSAIALGVDFGCFAVLIAGGMPPAAASAIGYNVGILVHWAISSRAVFTGRIAVPGRARRRQQILFLASALVGLGLTVGIVGLGTLLGVTPLIAKGMAIAVSFQVSYMLRQHIVFGR